MIFTPTHPKMIIQNGGAFSPDPALEPCARLSPAGATSLSAINAKTLDNEGATASASIKIIFRTRAPQGTIS